ncbi:hypothetical protein [Adhaeribacter soli]|uniref:Septum formation inhibitor Maf n=1 Tax=Adhaeribacter soli TaxID=2607655 RepID=A0A5N1J3V5_9BACT|nr:hypothetical protein [Adhaeribacter soli]KAA9345581.1 hypothetical protein F0P94_00385 [Adhaeribacter soli]
MKGTFFFRKLGLGLLLLACSCQGGGEKKRTEKDINFTEFGKYWYQGQAEVNTYELEQFRYGEKRPAEAVLIFVTEDLSKKTHIKPDAPAKDQVGVQKVLKLNLTKKFTTGIYPYSMMLSVFSPVYEEMPALKITGSCQEWCGQTFTQLNYRPQAYEALQRSYFESDGDRELTLKARSEDELWTLIRLNPKLVPTGNLDLIPGLLDLRFTHKPLQAYRAGIEIKPAAKAFSNFKKEQLRVCSVRYHYYPRQLHIYFSSKFPYEIAGWEEVHVTPNGKPEISRATRKAVEMLAYWKMNGTKYDFKRKELLLE